MNCGKEVDDKSKVSYARLEKKACQRKKERESGDRGCRGAGCFQLGGRTYLLENITKNITKKNELQTL